MVTRTTAPDPLDTLSAQAETFDAESGAPVSGPGSPAEPAPERQTNGKTILMAAQIIRETLCTIAKVESPRATLSDAALTPAADAIGAVLDKHGIDLAGAAGNWLPEIQAAMLTIPLILTARAALVAEIADKKPQPKPAEPEQAGADPAGDGDNIA